MLPAASAFLLGVFELAEHLRFAQDHGIKAAGNAQHMPHGIFIRCWYKNGRSRPGATP